MRVPRFRDLSLRVKLTLVTTLVAGMSLAIDCAAILASTWWGSRTTSVYDLATRADIVGSNCTAAITFNDRASAADTLKGLAADKYMLAACIYGRDGRPFADYRPQGATVVIPPQAGESQHRFDGGKLTVLRPITLDGETIGSIWLAWNWGLYHSQFLDLTGIVFGVMVISLGIALFFATRLQRVFTQPVLDLVETARRVTLSRQYTERARKHAQDELGALTDAFNEMLTQIQERDVALRQAYDELEERVRQRTEQLNEAKERAESADRAKSEFLANMSHEIRTPMTAILGFSEMLTEPSLPEPQRLNAVHTIRRNGEHLLSILNDVLDLSKIEVGRMTVERILCSPAGVVAEVLSLMRVRADAKKLSLDCEYQGAVPEAIQSDPTRLRQILLNLVGNAIKFTKVGGVRLIVRLVTSEAPMIQFDVVDTGVGITREQAARLFQPFTQGDASTTRKFGGTGLGLLIAKRLAEVLGGDVTIVDTKPGVGACVRATVPVGSLDGVRIVEAPAGAIALALAPVSEDAIARPPAPLHCRVLLAEDGVDNQRLISLVLTRAGANVTIAGNGQIAVTQALAAEDAGRPFDIILMDVQMPELDGHEAARRLRRAGYFRPIIALTAHAMSSDRERCLEAGCNDYATKPIDRAKLIEMIRAHTTIEPLAASGVGAG
ncbi:MAG: ATP-binding protein [Planctomycetota bacterium]